MFIVYCNLTEKCVNDLILSYSGTLVAAMDNKRRPAMERALSLVIHLLINLRIEIHALRYPNLFRVIWVADGIYWWTSYNLKSLLW